MNISSNISSIYAQQNTLNSSAHNVANSNTDGFTPQSAIVTSNEADTPQASIAQADDQGSPRSETDLAKEIPQQIESLRATEANASAIKTQDDVLGTLLDIKA